MRIRNQLKISILEALETIPWLFRTYTFVKNKLTPTPPFTNSREYWIERYRQGGHSGAGSYNRLARYKAEVINAFIQEHVVKEVIELGCGDGNQLSYLQVPTYTGYDLSPHALAQCRRRFAGDPDKSFLLMEDWQSPQADLTLSLDVIYHLVEDDIFESYMQQLFDAARRFVIIYAVDSDENFHTSVSHSKHLHLRDDNGQINNNRHYHPHVRVRKFTNWIEKQRPDFKLLQHIENPYRLAAHKPQTTSFSDFYIYAAKGAIDVTRTMN